jgi:hypothetical protein
LKKKAHPKFFIFYFFLKKVLVCFILLRIFFFFVMRDIDNFLQLGDIISIESLRMTLSIRW